MKNLNIDSRIGLIHSAKFESDTSAHKPVVVREDASVYQHIHHRFRLIG